MADINWEPTHFAREPGGQAICGVALAHPFNVSCDPAWVECKRCVAMMCEDGKREPLPAGAVVAS